MTPLALPRRRPDLPTLGAAAEAWLARTAFAPRTRAEYAKDLAPLLAALGTAPADALTPAAAAAFLAAQAGLAPATANRRLAAMASPACWCLGRGYLTVDPTAALERRPLGKAPPRALDPARLEAALRAVADPCDRALFWLIYECGLRTGEALAIDLEDLDWHERSIRIAGKGGKGREAFFSRQVGRLLDDYLAGRGQPAGGPLFVTHRKARSPRRADLAADGTARLTYRQADTRWKACTRACDPRGAGWDLHQLRHTAITVRAARGYTEVELKRFSGHSSLRSLEVYIAPNREAAKRKAREWERLTRPDA